MRRQHKKYYSNLPRKGEFIFRSTIEVLRSVKNKAFVQYYYTLPVTVAAEEVNGRLYMGVSVGSPNETVQGAGIGRKNALKAARGRLSKAIENNIPIVMPDSRFLRELDKGKFGDSEIISQIYEQTMIAYSNFKDHNRKNDKKVKVEVEEKPEHENVRH